MKWTGWGEDVLRAYWTPKAQSSPPGRRARTHFTLPGSLSSAWNSCRRFYIIRATSAFKAMHLGPHICAQIILLPIS